MKKLPILAMLLFIATAVLPIAGNAAKATANHPNASTAAATVVKPAKPLPAPKKETKPAVVVEEDVYWVPGDWYWSGDDWAWADGYWLDQPFADAAWVPGHWANRWWGVTWVPGYWY